MKPVPPTSNLLTTPGSIETTSSTAPEVLGLKPDPVKRVSAHVLVVDDELLIRWSLAETLLAAGHTVTQAASAAETERGLDPPPDVVLLDYRLPDSADLGLLAAIRRRAPRAAVILMTAFGSPEITDAAIQLGVYRVLSKPFDIHDIAALVTTAYDARRR